ncbi:hypothetical protein Sjap_013584 [Stephania japonica]|uniref:C2H2-type domain-containing protein n=1 Tax=Stephania japonica TaxID=461633 RepID=A0AAP0NXT3_9MAGN
MAMQFWGAEVKAGEPFKVKLDENMLLHLSQAALGEVKKDKANESAVIYVKVGEQKLVIGTLTPDKCATLSYDLVFEKEFEISHNWKHGSVYFCGYKTYMDEEENSGFSDSSDEEEELKLFENGKPEPKEEEKKPTVDKAKAVVKPDSLENKPKVKVVEPKKDDGEDDSDDDDEDDSDEDEDSDDEDEMMVEGEIDSSDEDDEEDSSDEEDEATPTPKKADKGKKRPADSAVKTPATEKKAKLVTPQKGADGKKGGVHVATPHPAKQAGKTPANNDKSKQQTPKSGGQFACKPCNKSFNSDNALQSHNKAKHSAGK